MNFPALLLLLLAFVLARPLQALTIAGGGIGTASSVAEGTALGSDNRSYVFITPRHFLFSHVTPPTTIGGATVNQSATSFLTASSVGSLTFGIGEINSNIAGLAPLPVLGWSNNPADYLNLDLRVFGNSGVNYGHQSAGAAVNFGLRFDKPNSLYPNPPYPLTGTVQGTGLFDTFDGHPDDLYMLVDLRPQRTIIGTAALQSGDSNAALVGKLGNGSLVAVGAALAVIDDETPYDTGNPLDYEANVYPFAGFYKAKIDQYLVNRTVALGNTVTYQASYVLVPEPSRFLLLLLAGATLLVRRQRC